MSIEDHGGGVPDDELNNLFKPFYRIGEARERSTGGIGLGLAIADRAIAAHDGSIYSKKYRRRVQGRDRAPLPRQTVATRSCVTQPNGSAVRR